MASKIIFFNFLLFLFFLSDSRCLCAQKWIQAGYWYSGTDLPIRDINSGLYTHLLCAFAHPNASTNKLSVESSIEHHFSTFTETVKRKNPSVVTLLSIYGGGENNTIFFSIIKQASTRKSFIDSSIKTARAYGFEGIALCCVLPNTTSSDMNNLGKLFNEWREAINSESRNPNQSQLLLTMEAHHSPSIESVSYPIDSLKTNLDWVSIRSYDYYVPLRDTHTGAHAALYDPYNRTNTNFVVNQWISIGLPANKLVMGLPFHGYAWTLVSPNDNPFVGAIASGPDTTQDGSMGYKYIKSFIQDFGYGATSVYNATFVVNYYYSIRPTWINFDDVEAVRAKVSYAKEKRLLGYCVWQLNNDDNWVLSRAAHGEYEDPHNRQYLLVKILLPVAIIILLLGFVMCYLKQRVFKSRGSERPVAEDFKSNDPNLQVLSFATINAATSEFSRENKLGEGGYGPVYKGKLLKGQKIAVKRLSETSHQGLEEFENEVTLTAKLQHVNLVRVLGYCTEKKEKMLIYEYMPNKSLDFYLFDPIRRHQLDWRQRIHIIEGVTQGLLYLQEYSNFTVIHRDIKVSNILLDSEMNAKISDFGMAKIFSKEEHEANTGRIVGTYGYVPPEYVREGIYSMKYDVYSFGVLLLQIAHELWKEGRGMEFFDPSLDDSSSSCKLDRCLQIALLCVQENPVDRPSMLEVYSMLKNESAVMATPKRPAFSIKIDQGKENSSIPHEEICSANDVSLSQMLPR